MCCGVRGAIRSLGISPWHGLVRSVLIVPIGEDIDHIPCPVRVAVVVVVLHTEEIPLPGRLPDDGKQFLLGLAIVVLFHIRSC